MYIKLDLTDVNEIRTPVCNLQSVRLRNVTGIVIGNYFVI